MNISNLDITRRPNSAAYIFDNLNSLFSDSVILDLNLRIIGISAKIQKCLNYEKDEMLGQSLSLLGEGGSLENKIREKLVNGFFSDEEAVLATKFGKSLRFSASGFYLGLFSEFTDIIVVRFSSQQEVYELGYQLRLAKEQLDNFIYRAAHDIRGPLATMQGLINLLKIRPDDREVDGFVELLHTHARKLDERLSQLVHLAQAD